MAKKKENPLFDEQESELSRQIESEFEGKIEGENIEVVEEKEIEEPETINKKMALETRSPNSKLNLTTKNGIKKLWTLEEALLPHNLRQLSEKVQKGLLGYGKSATQILDEIDANSQK